VWRHYSDKVENVHIALRQIYSGHYVPNFVSTGPSFVQDTAKYFGVCSWFTEYTLEAATPTCPFYERWLHVFRVSYKKRSCISLVLLWGWTTCISHNPSE